MHPSHAPVSHTSTLALLWRLGARVSCPLVDLRASHRPRCDTITIRLRTRCHKEQTDATRCNYMRRGPDRCDLMRIDATRTGETDSQTGQFLSNEKTDSTRPTYRPARPGEKTDRQDRRCNTMHVDGLSQTPCETLVGPRELVSRETSDLKVASGCR